MKWLWRRPKPKVEEVPDETTDAIPDVQAWGLNPIREVLEEIHPGPGRQVPPVDYDALIVLAQSAGEVATTPFWNDVLDQIWWAREAVITDLKAGKVKRNEAVGAIKAFDAFMRLPEAVIARLEQAQSRRGLSSKNQELVNRAGLVRKER